jgi:hypothetical protein
LLPIKLYDDVFGVISSLLRVLFDFVLGFYRLGQEKISPIISFDIFKRSWSVFDRGTVIEVTLNLLGQICARNCLDAEIFEIKQVGNLICLLSSNQMTNLMQIVELIAYHGLTVLLWAKEIEVVKCLDNFRVYLFVQLNWQRTFWALERFDSCMCKGYVIQAAFAC